MATVMSQYLPAVQVDLTVELQHLSLQSPTEQTQSAAATLAGRKLCPVNDITAQRSHDRVRSHEHKSFSQCNAIELADRSTHGSNKPESSVKSRGGSLCSYSPAGAQTPPTQLRDYFQRTNWYGCYDPDLHHSCDQDLH